MAVKQILVVDDEESYTSMLKLVLEDTGEYEVRVENDPIAALETARWHTPHLALVDVVMPKMSGLEMVERLRKNDRWKNVPIVFLTAISSRENPGKDHQLMQSCPVLTKPISADDLMDCLRKTLESKP